MCRYSKDHREIEGSSYRKNQSRYAFEKTDEFIKVARNIEVRESTVIVYQSLLRCYQHKPITVKCSELLKVLVFLPFLTVTIRRPALPLC